MTRKGTVVEVDKNTDTLLVLLENEKVCTGCAKEKQGCSFAGGCPLQTVSAADGCGAKKGDRVLLQAAGARVVLSYVLIFLFPLLVAFIGAFALYGLTDERFAAICFFLHWICALLAVRFTVEKRKGAFVRYTAVNTLPKTEEDADYER